MPVSGGGGAPSETSARQRRGGLACHHPCIFRGEITVGRYDGEAGVRHLTREDLEDRLGLKGEEKILESLRLRSPVGYHLPGNLAVTSLASNFWKNTQRPVAHSSATAYMDALTEDADVARHHRPCKLHDATVCENQELVYWGAQNPAMLDWMAEAYRTGLVPKSSTTFALRLSAELMNPFPLKKGLSPTYPSD